jgi:HD-GYP domain-containing protein (c-di-GMP phosphodiesterase class II)
VVIAGDGRFAYHPRAHFMREEAGCLFGVDTRCNSMKQDSSMFSHHDPLSVIGHNDTLERKIGAIHATLQTQLPFIARIATTLYDDKTDMVKTFLHSSGDARPLTHYQAKLSDAPSLMEIAEKRRPRVVNDLAIFGHGMQHHTRHIKQEAYVSSYTMPMYARGALFGFVFFNSYESSAFTEENLRLIDLYGHLITMTVINDLDAVKNMLATVNAARDISHLRDDETSSHQDRMSRYARLIARKIALQHGFTDEYVENVFIFSALHDIGKIGVPDNILLKPGKLTETEFAEMKSHTVKGRQLIDRMFSGFDLNTMPHIGILRNITELHHEAMDGSGYPHGYTGEDIPIEARITTVADVFDALTSHRPYKEHWSNDEALALLQQKSGIKFDRDCVNALTQSHEEVKAIQRQFREDVSG